VPPRPTRAQAAIAALKVEELTLTQRRADETQAELGRTKAQLAVLQVSQPARQPVRQSASLSVRRGADEATGLRGWPLDGHSRRRMAAVLKTGGGGRCRRGSCSSSCSSSLFLATRPRCGGAFVRA
jgi:hypothetical protein